MDYLNKFSERLKELITESNKSDKEIAKIVGVHRTTIGKYKNGKDFPSTDTFIKLADLFCCSCDYLLGRNDDVGNNEFKNCPPFSKQLDFLLIKYKISKRALAKNSHIPESIIYQWRDGKYKPTVVNIIRLADYFDCSVDAILGREK